MTIVYKINGNTTVSGTGQYCSGTSAEADTPGNNEVDTTGGGGNPTITHNGAGSTTRWFHFQSDAAIGETTWPSGTVTVTLNLATANSNVTWLSTYVCKTGPGTDGTWGSETGTPKTLDADTNMTISVSEIAAHAGDYFFIVCPCQIDAGAHGNQSVTINASTSTISTPFTAPSGAYGGARLVEARRQSDQPNIRM